jgi:ribosomal protein L12E/L44/L45/RPP1/RPP2
LGQQTINYTAENYPGSYSLLLRKGNYIKERIMEEIVSAASTDEKRLEIFIAGYNEAQITEQLLEECLVLSCRKRQATAVASLLQHGVDPNGAQLPSGTDKPLIVAL